MSDEISVGGESGEMEELLIEMWEARDHAENEKTNSSRAAQFREEAKETIGAENREMEVKRSASDVGEEGGVSGSEMHSSGVYMWR